MKSDKEMRPWVGVGVMIMHQGKILVGKRRSQHGQDSWSFPGGHLEYGETPEECAQREAMEEAGVELSNLRPGPFTNDFFLDSRKHYVTLYVIADLAGGEPEVKEPDKCETWQWFSWDELPKPLFLPLKNLKSSGFQPPSG